MEPEVIGAEIEAFGQEVFESSGRSLDLLRNIETTLKVLHWLSKKANADCEFALASIEAINRAGTRVEDVAKAEKAVETLERAQNAVGNLNQQLVEKRGYAMVDENLHPEDGVVDAFTEAISATADLHNALNNLRWAIAELIVDSETGEPKVYAVEDLAKFLADLKR